MATEETMGDAVDDLDAALDRLVAEYESRGFVRAPDGRWVRGPGVWIVRGDLTWMKLCEAHQETVQLALRYFLDSADMPYAGRAREVLELLEEKP